jgi:hypothetical protein
MGKLCLRPKIVGAIGYVVLPILYGMGVTELQVCRNCKKSRFLWTYYESGIKISLDIKDNV